jgi:hypothetical protein
MNFRSVAFFLQFTIIAATIHLAVAEGNSSHWTIAAPAAFRARFFQLCDRAVEELNKPGRKEAFFIDSYAVRALCVAYDMTGQAAYLDTCKAWADRTVAFQEKMIPRGAYFMNYYRKPGQEKGDWYAADSSSIAMGVLATAIRSHGKEKERFLNSVKSFAALVMDNYVGPSGGIRNGLWSKFDGEWWCCSGTFGSLAFLLYDETGDARYLRVALGALDWLNQLDLTKDQPFPLSDMGPTMLMYALEAYSAGLSHVKLSSPTGQATRKKLDWALNWIATQQDKPPLERTWPSNRGWGMKSGGLPFHQYVFARLLPGHRDLTNQADQELAKLGEVVFVEPLSFTQLPVFMMMSYAERLSPGAVHRSSHCVRTSKAIKPPNGW